MASKIDTILHIFLVFSIQLSAVSGLTKNIIVDDTYGDPVTGQLVTYAPDDWNVGQDCAGCTAHPDASQLFDNTWHDNSFFPQDNVSLSTASIMFNGGSY